MFSRFNVLDKVSSAIHNIHRSVVPMLLWLLPDSPLARIVAVIQVDTHNIELILAGIKSAVIHHLSLA